MVKGAAIHQFLAEPQWLEDSDITVPSNPATTIMPFCMSGSASGRKASCTGWVA